MTFIKSVRTRVWNWTDLMVPPSGNLYTNASGALPGSGITFSDKHLHHSEVEE